MTNMSYCRFQNTFQDLQDCYNALKEYDFENLSEPEQYYRNKLVQLCKEIGEEFRKEPNGNQFFEWPKPPQYDLPILPDGYSHELLDSTTKEVLLKHGKIPAIKFLKEYTKLGLREAKEYVEAL